MTDGWMKDYEGSNHPAHAQIRMQPGEGREKEGKERVERGVSEQRQEGETFYMIWVRKMGQAVSAHSPSISWYQQIT
jgi:hypothetical protein